MSDRPLVDLAWQVDALLAEDHVRVRFLEKCWEYLRLKVEKDWPNALPFTGDPDSGWPEEPKQPGELCVSYAVLAALHEAHLSRRETVDPAPWPQGEHVFFTLLSWKGSMLRNNRVWSVLVSEAKELHPTNHQLRSLRACLKAVKRDLKKQAVSSTENEAGTPSTQQCTETPPEKAGASVTVLSGDAADAVPLPEQISPAAPEGNGNSQPRPDGPEPPHWLWCKGERIRIGKGRSHRSWSLLSFFWQRNSAEYEDLCGQGLEKPWPDPVTDPSIVTAVTRFNKDMPSGFPWKLRTKNRTVYKESA
jgi:hypothetical protein